MESQGELLLRGYAVSLLPVVVFPSRKSLGQVPAPEPSGTGVASLKIAAVGVGVAIVAPIAPWPDEVPVDQTEPAELELARGA